MAGSNSHPILMPGVHAACGCMQAEFKPVVQLDEVETSTGEEDEDPLLEMWVLHELSALPEHLALLTSPPPFPPAGNASSTDMTDQTMSGRSAASASSSCFSTRRTRKSACSCAKTRR